jgi:hypothetical protein
MKNRYYKHRYATFTTYYRVSDMVGKSMTITVYDDGSGSWCSTMHESELTRATKITEQEYNEVAGQIYASL